MRISLAPVWELVRLTPRARRTANGRLLRAGRPCHGTRPGTATMSRSTCQWPADAGRRGV